MAGNTHKDSLVLYIVWPEKIGEVVLMKCIATLVDISRFLQVHVWNPVLIQFRPLFLFQKFLFF
jgi:hypothetical protein